MRILALLFLGLSFIASCSKDDDESSDIDTASSQVAGNCFVDGAKYYTEVLCWEILGQKGAAEMKEACSLSFKGTWTANEACDVPEGTKGCKTTGATNDYGTEQPTTTVYYVGINISCSVDQTPIYKR